MKIGKYLNKFFFLAGIWFIGVLVHEWLHYLDCGGQFKDHDWGRQQERKICKKFLLEAIETLQQITKTYKCECGNEMEVTWVRGLKPTKVVECDKCGKTAQVIT